MRPPWSIIGRTAWPSCRVAPVTSTLGVRKRARTMGETSELLQTVSETEIVQSFHGALSALYPILLKLDCIEDDTQLWDPFDRIADLLWDELVLQSLKWKYGLDSKPQLSAYGFSGVQPGIDGYIRVRTAQTDQLRLLRFIGDRSVGTALFNAVDVFESTGAEVRIPLAEVISFHWERP